MANIHGKDTGLLVADQDLAQYFRGAEASNEVEMAETAAYGKEAKTYIPGLADGTLELEGMFDAAADAKLESYLQSANGEPVTLALDGFADGKRVKMLKQRQAKYSVSAPIGDVVAAAVTMQADGSVDHGVALKPIAAHSGSNSGVGIDNGAATANGGVGHLHVTANDRDGTATLKIQHSSDDVTYVDLVTFTVVNAATTTSERVVVAEGTTVNRYLRRNNGTGGATGAVTYQTSFARR